MSEPDPKRVRAGKLSRRKGKVFERLVCKMFRDAGFTAERSQQYKGNADSADIQVAELGRWHLECKHSKVVNMKDWIRQASTDAGEFKTWAVIYKKDREMPMFVTQLSNLSEGSLARFLVDRDIGIVETPLHMAISYLADVYGIKRSPI